MKLLRFGAAGKERPGILDQAGRIRDLSDHVADITSKLLAPSELDSLRRLPLDRLPVVEGHHRLAPPVADIGKYIAIGLNYVDHAEESGMPIPAEPVVFTKATSCIAGPNDAIVIPRKSTKLDWEVELAIVIGRRAKEVDPERALDHVAGYCVANDVSERSFQLERGGSWDKGKSFDTFGPLGPYLVTADEIPDVQALPLWLDVNGQRMQTGHTSKMIFTCAQIVSYVSEVMTLNPGDVITTGTPPGVGMGMKPARYLKAGDVVSLGIEGLGQQIQQIVHS